MRQTVTASGLIWSYTVFFVDSPSAAKKLNIILCAYRDVKVTVFLDRQYTDKYSFDIS